jgi:hypothetical protein
MKEEFVELSSSGQFDTEEVEIKVENNIDNNPPRENKKGLIGYQLHY